MAAACGPWLDGEVFVAAELPGVERLCACGVLCAVERGGEEEGECGAGGDLPPLPYLLGEVAGSCGIDRATIPAA